VIGEFHNDKALHALEVAQQRGMIGGRLADHVAHAAQFADQWLSEENPSTVVDLGSGGGLPGLVLAEVWPDAEFLLTETREKRADTLQQGVRAAGWQDRVRVWSGDVQDSVSAGYRGWADVVCARLFASPALTAECAAPLLRIGGCLIVSEPPNGSSRWPEGMLDGLGLVLHERVRHPHFVRILKVRPTPEKYPRTRRQMEKRPLW